MGNGDAIIYAFAEGKFIAIGKAKTSLPIRQEVIAEQSKICLSFRVKASKRMLARLFGKKPKYTYKTLKR